MSGPIIDVWHGERQTFGRLGRPQPWVNVLGRVSADDSPIYTAAFQCNDGPFTPLVLGPSAYRLRSPGDFNIELPTESLRPGLNNVQVWASDHAGRVTRRDVALEYAGSRQWPLPYGIEWDKVGRLQEAVQVIDGQWSHSAAGLRPVTLAYDRIVAVGDMGWRNLEVTVDYTIHGYEQTPATYGWPSYGPAIGLMVGWQGHSDWGDIVPRRGWHPFGALSVYRWKKDGPMCRQLWGGVGTRMIGEEQRGSDPDLERPYRHKVRSAARPGRPNYYGMKIWPADSPEPQGWDLEGDGLAGSLDSGAILLLAHHTDATFGRVTIEPL
jgi:hypothetical protein